MQKGSALLGKVGEQSTSKYLYRIYENEIPDENTGDLNYDFRRLIYQGNS